MDSVYMTVISLSTIGYGEVNPVSQTGRIFTLFLIVMGVGFFLYVIGNVVQFLVDNSLGRLWTEMTGDREALESQCDMLAISPSDQLSRVDAKDPRRVPQSEVQRVGGELRRRAEQVSRPWSPRRQ